jgi:hypothetical protein
MPGVPLTQERPADHPSGCRPGCVRVDHHIVAFPDRDVPLRHAYAMLLRFEGGPVDGHEESSNTAPSVLFRTPPMSDILRAAETADEGTEMPLFGARYELVHFDEVAGVALYWPVDIE